MSLHPYCARVLLATTAPFSPVSRTTSYNSHCLQTYTSDRTQTKRQTHTLPLQRRLSSTKRHVSTAILPTSAKEVHGFTAATPSVDSMKPVVSSNMSCLPWTTLMRSYLITAVSSIPVLLKPSLASMAFLAHSKSRFFNPDHNPVLHALMKKTFYVQFCAGENPKEVRQTIKDLKNIGYSGVILGHAREVVLTKAEEDGLDTQMNAEQEETSRRDVEQWRDATMETVKLATAGDYVAIKFTGSGRQALQHLKKTIPCANTLRDAIHEICILARERGVKMLFDAEQAALQQGIDNWTLYYMRHHNKDGQATVFGTYQSYAKRTPNLLAQHLQAGSEEGFTVGVKLVRGAYINSDPRNLFWDTIEDTHKCYDNLAECVIERKYGGLLQPINTKATEFPNVELVLASHNADSVRKARKIRDHQAVTGRERIPLAYGQLMGMADHVSCELVQEAKERRDGASAATEVPQPYKYLVWGTMGECMKYLLRRAQENKDAVSRTVDARRALGKEIARRFGLARP